MKDKTVSDTKPLSKNGYKFAITKTFVSRALLGEAYSTVPSENFAEIASLQKLCAEKGS